MPKLRHAAHGGTERHECRWLQNEDYCIYCYKDGAFTRDCTMEEMIDFCAQFVDEVNKNMPKPMTQEEYKQMMRQYFPMLKRWKSAQ